MTKRHMVSRDASETTARIVAHRCDRCGGVERRSEKSAGSRSIQPGWARLYTLWHVPDPIPREACIDVERITRSEGRMLEQDWRLCPECWLILASFLHTRGSASQGQP